MRTKIAVLLLIPLLAVVVLSGLRLNTVFTDMGRAGRAEQVAAVVRDANALVHELQAERDLTAAFLGQQRGFGGDTLNEERGRVDSVRAAYQDSASELEDDFGSLVTDRMRSVRTGLDELANLRDAADRGLSPWPTLDDSYSGIISDLLSLQEGITQGLQDRELAQALSALGAVSRVKELFSAERGYLSYIFGIGRFQTAEYREFLRLDARTAAAQSTLQGALSDRQRDAYAQRVNGQLTTPVGELKETAIAEPARQDLTTRPDQWYNTATAMLDAVRQSEIALGEEVHNRATELSDDARRQAWIDGGIVLAVLVSTALFGLLVLASMVRPLRGLRTAATGVATDLPAAVRRLGSTEHTDLDASAPAVPVRSTDEVGEVSEAFNVVHREAVRVAVEQALLRKNVSTMFVNLSRRTQSLVERQLRVIDELEEGDRKDTDSMGELFHLDHLATRMRRNAENLLVLAGSESGRRWNRPVVLLDVLRAAATEVEQYPRVAQTHVADREIDGRAVSDVVHLVAELLENALEFSSPDTQVVVSARSLPGDAGVMVQIEDRGIGMSVEELATANERLSNASEVDVSLSRMMGLYVVGKLAARHDIRVQLTHSANGGVAAMIHLPAGVVVDEEAAGTAAPLATPVDRVEAEPEPAAVSAGTGGELVDLGEHETRPILDNRPRPRPWRAGEEGGLAEDDAQAVGGPPPPGGPAEGDERSWQSFDESEFSWSQEPGDVDGPVEVPSDAATAEFMPGGRPGLNGDGPRQQDMSTGLGETPPVGWDTGAHPAQGLGRPDPYQEERAPWDTGGHAVPVQGERSPSAWDTGGHAVPAQDEWAAEPAASWDTGAHSAADVRPPDSPVDSPTGPVPVPGPVGEQSRIDIAEALSSGPLGAEAEPTLPGETTGTHTMAEQQSPPEGGDARPDGEEYLPIYAQVESEWFRQRPARPSAAPPPPPPDAWQSAADDGWRAAEQIAKPRVSGTTKSGLPLRVPMAHYVPGSAGPARPGASPGGSPDPASPQPAGEQPSVPPEQEPGEPAGDRTPEAVRGLLSNYHRGLRQGREAGRHRTSDGDEQGH